jgi:hypothetical protein
LTGVSLCWEDHSFHDGLGQVKSSKNLERPSVASSRIELTALFQARSTKKQGLWSLWVIRSGHIWSSFARKLEKCVWLMIMKFRYECFKSSFIIDLFDVMQALNAYKSDL